jgi:hypothetical protein
LGSSLSSNLIFQSESLEKDGALAPSFFLCAPDWAHSLGSESPMSTDKSEVGEQGEPAAWLELREESRRPSNFSQPFPLPLHLFA